MLPYAFGELEAVINAAGTLTRLGGGPLAPQVCEAMAAAARRSVRLERLHEAVGRQFAEATGAEAALVTAGASAALTLGAAACLAGLDAARMDRLPQTIGMPNQIVVARSQRNAYDHALRAAGAELVEVGLAERTRDPQSWEIEAAIGPQTVAVAFAAGFSRLDLDDVVRVAHERALPVIVDASATLPPRANLRAFIRDGADLVAYSGGKGLRGPQSTGILCGRRELVASAALQMWDLDYLPELWDPPGWLVDRAVVERGVPNHGIGRSMKVGKEELAGLSVALSRFLADSDEQEIARLDALSTQLAGELKSLDGACVELLRVPDRWLQVWLVLDGRRGCSGIELVRRLQRGAPPVEPIQSEAREGRVGFDPFCLRADEVLPLAGCIRASLA